MGGKSKKQTIGYKYYLGMHQIMCHGPIDAITRVTVDDRLAWSGTTTGGQITINATELFGGESREGGVSGLIDIEMGGDTQGQNSYLVSKLGALIPAYRGVVGAVFRQCYLGNNPYLKAWRFRGQRIHKRQNGIAQWYDAKAAINSRVVAWSDSWRYKEEGPGSAANYSSPSYDDSAWATGPGGFGNNPLGAYSLPTYPVGTTPPSNTIIFGGSIPTTAGNIIWIRKDIGPSAGPLFVEAWHDDGARIWVNGTELVLTYDNYFHSFTEIPGNLLNASGPNVVAVKVTDSVPEGRATYIYAAVQIVAGQVDINPAHVIRECLTDPDWGMGYTDADIDDDSFMAAADQLALEGLGISLLWDRQIKLEEFIDEIKKHIDAALYVSRTTGKFVLKLIRQDFDEGSLLSLDESNVQRVEDPIRVSFGELVNSVTVNYWDSSTGKDASLTVTDTAMVQMQGAVINAPLQYPGFTIPRNATIAAQRDLRALSTPGLSCTIYADSSAKVLNIGDAFKFSWSRWGLADAIMRVVGIAYGTGKNNQVRIYAKQDVYDTATTLVVTTSANNWEDPSAPPSAPDYELAEEAPYYEVVQIMGQADTDNKLLTHPEIGYVLAAASRGGSAINARMWTDTGDGYEDTGALDFSPAGLLGESITKTQTSFALTDMQDAEEVVLGTHFQIGDELMRIDTLDTVTGSVTVGRGVLDTVPQLHSAGDFALFWDQYAGLDPGEYVQGEEVDVKITPVSGAGVLPIGDAAAMTVTLVGRAARPYAPGDLRVNGDSYLAGAVYDGEVTVSWTHRDRLQQTAGVLIDHTAGDIGPEPGTTYRLQGYINDVLVHTEDDIAGTSTTWTPSDTSENIKVEVHAKRDGIYSFQAPFHTFSNDAGGPRVTEEGDARLTEDGDARVSEG